MPRTHVNIAPLNPEDPRSLGDFELFGRVGQGGMGQVFLGESLGGEPAAVKVIKPSVVDSTSRLRFAQEIEVLKTIWGPRIAAFLGADAEVEQPWLATEYVDGPDLARHVRTHGPLPSVLTAALGAILAEALSGVHEQGLLHRDLKPANILLGPNGPKIIDFGLAAFTESSLSLTAPNQVVGTPVCMAPEQAAGMKPLTAAVDVYALGALLLFASTAHYPYEATSPYMVFHLVTSPDTAPNLSDVPEDLGPLVSAMLAQEAADRPSLTDVVQRCRALIEAQGMKIAQARRKLTAQTAGQHRATLSVDSLAVSWPSPPDDAPGTAPHAVAQDVPESDFSPASRLPTETEGTPAPVTVPSSSTNAPSESTSSAGIGATGTSRPNESVPDLPPATPQPPKPDPQQAPHPPKPQKQAAQSLRHSLQARRTAERLRAAYAATAPF